MLLGGSGDVVSKLKVRSKDKRDYYMAYRGYKHTPSILHLKA